MYALPLAETGLAVCIFTLAGGNVSIFIYKHLLSLLLQAAEQCVAYSKACANDKKCNEFNHLTLNAAYPSLSKEAIVSPHGDTKAAPLS
jgi:hypothetical protein